MEVGGWSTFTQYETRNTVSLSLSQDKRTACQHTVRVICPWYYFPLFLLRPSSRIPMLTTESILRGSTRYQVCVATPLYSANKTWPCGIISAESLLRILSHLFSHVQQRHTVNQVYTILPSNVAIQREWSFLLGNDAIPKRLIQLLRSRVLRIAMQVQTRTTSSLGSQTFRGGDK